MTDKKLSVNKPRKTSPTKYVESLNSTNESNFSEVHVDDIIQNVIERGIEESSRAKDPFSPSQQGTSKVASANSGMVTKSDFLPSQAQPPTQFPTTKPPNVPTTGKK